jgi:trimethylamine--corrinoid protein Co-methyltransferase
MKPQMTMMDRGDCLQIHLASLEILRQTGIQVFSEKGVELLRKAGAAVDAEKIRIPPSLVEWALSTVPGNFNLYKRGTQEVSMNLNGEEVYFGPGSDTLRYLDPRSGQRRDFKLADIDDCIRICDALPEIGFVMSVGVPQDVPQEKYYRYQYASMLRNTTKPAMVVCNNLADLEAIAAMAATAMGGMELLSKYPNFALYSEPSTPLQHSLEATEKLLFCAEHSIPVTHSPAPMMGGTAPVTLAGAVALGNAEMLSGLVMHQLQNPGAPFLYGHGVHNLDMKTMISVYGSPEFQLARVMAAGMGRFYGLPVWGYAAHSDSKVIDGQAAIDAQFSVMVAFMVKTNFNHDVGYLESGLTNSPEMMVLTDEVISMNRAFFNGVTLDADTLAVDVIHEVGPGGQFMNTDHTFEHWRDLWTPHLFDRQRLERWEKLGAKNINTRMREKTLALMDEYRVEPLPGGVEAEIERILGA